MNSKGFVLLEIVITIAIIALLVTGGFYLTNKGGESKSSLETGLDARNQAEEAARQFSARNEEVSKQIRDVGTGAAKSEASAIPAPIPTPKPVIKTDPVPTPVVNPTPAPTPFFMPAPTVSTNFALVPAPRQNCISNISPVFTHHITDMSKVRYVAPPPTMGSGPSLKTHGYIGSEGANVPVYAPMAMILKSGSHYVGGPYLLDFQASCEVTVRFGHITNPVDSIKKLLPSEPKADSRTQELSGVSFAAGDLIGYTVGTSAAGNWDFGVYNSTVINRYANDPSWNNSAVYMNAVCPFDYFAPNLKAAYTSKFDSRIMGGNPPHGESFCQI